MALMKISLVQEEGWSNVFIGEFLILSSTLVLLYGKAHIRTCLPWLKKNVFFKSQSLDTVKAHAKLIFFFLITKFENNFKEYK